MPVSACVADGEYWGIRFTLDEPQELLLGWQTDLLHSAATQEFRAEKVKLASYPTADIEHVESDVVSGPMGIYTLQGVRINDAQLNALPRGLYIVKGTKMVVK